MNNDIFEWDNAKAIANLEKHAISFEQAKGVFRDPFAIEFMDDRADYGEERYILIGMADNRILVVVYTLRNEAIRIISAREAEAYERRKYHEENL